MARKYDEIFKEEKPFNMAIAFLDRLNQRLDECNIAALQGDLIGWYRGLRTVLRMIYPLTKADKKGDELLEKVKERFNKVKNLLSGVYSGGTYGPKNIQEHISIMYISEAEIELDGLEMDLNDLMYKYKLVFPDLNKGKSDKNYIKMLEMYVPGKKVKEAYNDIDKFKEIVPELYEHFYKLYKPVFAKEKTKEVE
jgi:archaellum component FlaC